MDQHGVFQRNMLGIVAVITLGLCGGCGNSVSLVGNPNTSSTQSTSPSGSSGSQSSSPPVTPPSAPPPTSPDDPPATPPVTQPSTPPDTSPVVPAPLVPFGGQDGKFQLLQNWTFGANRVDSTIHNKAELDQNFFYRYINAHGTLDSLPVYWSYHRDYPEGDPRSLHVFGDDTLTLKGRVPPGGGLFRGGIQSGMLRAKEPITPGMYIEMRAKLTTGLGVWPAFWLGAGVEYVDGTFSATPWPPEIDIFEFFNWQGRPTTRVMTAYVHSNGKPAKYGNPYDIFTKFTNSEYVPGFDFSADFHVFALDWRTDAPIWLLDGVPIKQTHYEWPAPPAHLLVTNQIGINFAGVNLAGMTADESQWDYVIDYIRIWSRTDQLPGETAIP